MSFKMMLVLLAQLCLCLTVSARDLSYFTTALPGMGRIDDDDAGGASSSCGHQMAPADIAILLDSTFSIKRENWDGVKDLVKNVADRVNYGPEETRIASIRWSRKAKQVIGLDDFSDKQDMFTALDGVEFRGGGGQVHKALNVLREKTFRQPRDNVAMIGVLVIDEKSHNTPAALAAAEKLNDEGVKMIVIGVKRRRFDMDELVEISFDESRVILIDDIRDLNKPEVLEQVMDLICADANEEELEEEHDADEPLWPAEEKADPYEAEGKAEWGTWHPWTTCSNDCGDGLKTRTRTCVGGEGASCEGEATENGSCEGWEGCGR